MFDKPINKTKLNDVKNLVKKRRERENNHLDYKKELNNTNEGKEKFLKAVTGFANADGGYLIIGVEEKREGIPDKICGVGKTIGRQKIDEWINNILISNIDRKVHYEIKIFEIENKKVVVVLYIPESPKKPHMITFKNRNNYYIRHNTSVNIATHSEVKEMFEYSKKIMDKFEDLLRERNLFDEKDINFGVNENSKRLYNRITEELEGIKKPFILYSFIPKYLDENRINTISQEFIDWLDKNSKNFFPAQNIRLFDILQKKVNLYGIIFPEILHKNEIFKKYFEILNNGFFESGISRYVSWNYRGRDNKKLKRPVLNLTRTIGYAWMLLNFSELFYKKINYYDEVVLLLSVINVKDFALGGFGFNWPEPFDFIYNYKPPKCSHEKFKIMEKFIVSEISSKYIKEIILDLSRKLSRAFGISVEKCFDKNGNFNNKGMGGF